VDNRAEVREFLTSRRAKLTPQQAGLPDVGARRVPGLRRGEVAALAGVSVEYYAKLECGARPRLCVLADTGRGSVGDLVIEPANERPR
jgi:hypothetical protein